MDEDSDSDSESESDSDSDNTQARTVDLSTNNVLFFIQLCVYITLGYNSIYILVSIVHVI